MHPGHATGKLVNAARLAGRVLAALPQDRLTPETTSDREGFIHVHSVEATAGKATIRTIVRDFDDEKLAEHVELLRTTAERIVGDRAARAARGHRRAPVPEHAFAPRQHPEVSAAAEEALRREGFEPKRVPARGGTDGSILSARGLPTPNLFTGGQEYHSVREWASVQDMASAAAVAVRLAGVWAERPAPEPLFNARKDPLCQTWCVQRDEFDVCSMPSSTPH